jgi:uncharacterized protein
MKRIVAAALLTLMLVATGCNLLPKKKATANSPNNSAGNPGTQPQIQSPAPQGLVNDLAFILDAQAKAELETRLKAFKDSAKVEFVVVTVATTGSQSPFDYSLAMAREWNVGKDNPDRAGLLMLIAVDDRKWHVQISKVLEKILSNQEVGDLGALMNDDFKQQKYSEGINKSVDAFIKTITERRPQQ